jgi:transposase
MIVIGVDVHKQSVTAVAVDEAGRMLDERTVAAGSDALIGWASALGPERLWALEDCRQLTRWLERQLLTRGEDLVRVPPKLMAPERRAGRTRGKSAPIGALAVARAALREPDLSRPRPGEQLFRDLKLLVDHRDDLVDERRRVPSNGCVGTCTSSIRPLPSHSGCLAGHPIWSVSAVGSPDRSKSCRCGSLASSSPAAAR